MKLKYRFAEMQIADDMIAVPVGNGVQKFHGAFRINGVTKDIMDLLKEETTEKAIIESLLGQYDASRDEVAESVRLVISTLRAEGLLVD